MQVLLDGHPLTTTDQTLAGAIAAAKASAEGRGRVIVDAKGDGASLTSEALGQGGATFKLVEFISADPVSLVSVSLSDGAEALRQVKQVHQAVAASIQAGKGSEAMGYLQESFRTWAAVRDLLDQSARLLSLDLSGYVAPGVHGEVSFDGAVSQMIKTLKGVQDAVQREDWSELTDLVGYDMDALADQWIGLLDGLAGHVKRVGGGAKG
jgi:hypothetical protein